MRYNYGRTHIDCSDLLRQLKLADANTGNGMLFHHRYKNNKGDWCFHLSEHNTVPLYIREVVKNV